MSGQATVAESLADKAQRVHEAQRAMERLYPALAGPGLTSDMADIAYALTALLTASEDVQAIRKEEERLRKEYLAGTSNAEDAWRDFRKEQERVWRNFNGAIAEINAKR